MRRALALLLLTACAGAPRVPICAEDGVFVEPDFLRVGNADILSASLTYTGCPDAFFRLCGVDEAWLDRRDAYLEIEQLPTSETCDEQALTDAELTLRSVRREYNALFGVDQATLTLRIGEASVDYAFGFEEDE